VLDGDAAPQEGAQELPSFRPTLLWPNGRPSQLLLSICFIQLAISAVTRLLARVPPKESLGKNE